MTGLALLIGRIGSALVPSLTTYFTLSFATWHLAIFAAVVGIVVIFLDKILLLLAWVGGLVIEVVVSVVAAILVWLLGQLPHVPTDLPGVAWSQFLAAMSAANRYAPVDVALDYLGVMVSAYSGLMVYKLVKFIRGGG